MTAPGVLTGFTVGITADRRWAEQAALFERRGAAVIHGPTIRTLPLGAEAPLRQATLEVITRPPDALIANTGVGIRSWFAHADSWGLGPDLHKALAGSRIYARGPKASGAVHSADLEVVARAGTERLSDVVDMVLEAAGPGKRVAVQLDGSGDSPEVDRLRRAGAEVVSLPVYRWTLPDDLGPALRLAEALMAGRVQAVTFTAGPAIRNWLAMVDREGAGEELRRSLTDGRAVVGSVGPICSEVAEHEGLGSAHLVQPDAYRLGPLVRAVTERLTERRMTVEMGTTSMVLSGNAVLVGGDCISLTETEARLLATLARRPNVVYSKEHLLRTVWVGTGGDAHTVEVGIARLRKRLGPHGGAIQSVHRRGYTLRV
ncbi:MAG TPA: uroporphyrinogen-III synthase [Acidimicrobiales bacterium]|nr:uroporphyrinogen-III synthase [Acidimicrobiales bacterium]